MGIVDRLLTLARRPGGYEFNGALLELLGGEIRQRHVPIQTWLRRVAGGPSRGF